jgi:hypothetical protein
MILFTNMPMNEFALLCEGMSSTTGIDYRQGKEFPFVTTPSPLPDE